MKLPKYFQAMIHMVSQYIKTKHSKNKNEIL